MSLNGGPYWAHYNYNANDKFAGAYAGTYASYAQGIPPATLTNQVIQTGSYRAMVHHLMLTRDATATPEDPGKIFLCHRLSRYEAMIDQPTPFDNQLHAFIGDSSNGQPPITIIMPTNFLHAANVVQVPTVAKLQQLMQDDPDAQSVGPFAAGDDDIEPVHVRKCLWIPNRYALLVFGDGVSPRLAWERIYPVVLAEAHDTECQDLIDWLGVAITRRAAGGSQVAMPPLQMETFISLAHNQAFQAYCLEVMSRDLPETLPGSHTASATSRGCNRGSCR
jgi:hypothetical protein